MPSSPMFDAPLLRAGAVTAPHSGLHNPQGCPWLGQCWLQPEPCAWWENCPGSGPNVLLSHPQHGWHRRPTLHKGEGRIVSPPLCLAHPPRLGSLQARAGVSCFPRSPCRSRHRAGQYRGQCTGLWSPSQGGGVVVAVSGAGYPWGLSLGISWVCVHPLRAGEAH